jgi:hypothetical protein
MNTIIKFVAVAILIAIVLIFISFFLLNWNELGGKLPDFLGNLLLNIVAEFVGLAVGLIFAAIIAKELAKNKLKELAPKLVRLIGHLRAGKTINREAARECVKCVVEIISDDSLEMLHSKIGKSTPANELCTICDLKYETELTSKGIACTYCKLEGSAWDNSDLKEAIKNSSDKDAVK